VLIYRQKSGDLEVFFSPGAVIAQRNLCVVAKLEVTINKADARLVLSQSPDRAKAGAHATLKKRESVARFGEDRTLYLLANLASCTGIEALKLSRQRMAAKEPKPCSACKKRSRVGWFYGSEPNSRHLA